MEEEKEERKRKHLYVRTCMYSMITARSFHEIEQGICIHTLGCQLL